jgi:conjugative transfer signal peptidase TraF
MSETDNIITRLLVKSAMALSILIVGVIVLSCYFVINTTPSYPVGIYKKIFNKEPQVGDLTLFCPPDNEATAIAYKRKYISAGMCPGNYGYLIKKILAAKKDRVRFTDEGIFINGQYLINSQPRLMDQAGRELSWFRGAYVLGENQVVMLSDHNPDSWDSRYFGILNKQQIKYVLMPLITSENFK